MNYGRWRKRDFEMKKKVENTKEDSNGDRKGN